MKKMTYYFTDIHNKKELKAVEKDMKSCGAQIHMSYEIYHPEDSIIEALVPENFMKKFEKTKSC